MEKNMNFSIDDGDAFFCHEISVNFNPLQFVLDFKSVTPRVDVRSKNGPSIRIKHNVVLMDPFHAKKTVELLSRVIADYEKQFGEIKKPKVIEKMEKNAKKKSDSKSKTFKTPTYFG